MTFLSSVIHTYALNTFVKANVIFHCLNAVSVHFTSFMCLNAAPYKQFILRYLIRHGSNLLLCSNASSAVKAALQQFCVIEMCRERLRALQLWL